MLLDARSEDVRLDRAARVAIVGAGPAGLTLARALAGIDDVIVIEGGGLEDCEHSQELLAGDCVGIDYPITETRALQFGGSSSLWAGYCALFDPHDFEPRPWVPDSGWPIRMEAIRPYFEQTAAILHLGDASFDARAIAARTQPAFPFEDEHIVPTVWRFGAPTLRLAEHARAEFEASPVTTLINAAVADIELECALDAVKSLEIRTCNGRTGRVFADVIVLACGGLETPRLLLASNRQLPRGVGNAHDVVGRYFMEHPHRSIEALTADARAFTHWTGRFRHEDRRECCFCVGLSERFQRSAGILNARAHVYRTPQMSADEPPRVGLFMEQAPDPASRVSLSDSVDCLGRRRIRLDWQLNELDWRSYQTTAEAIGAVFERRGAADSRAEASPSSAVMHSNHHLGTTRMSDDPERGVVDADCRVHGIRNLYVAGGSVFPTVSWANPTFTVIALTLRLADHLRIGWGASQIDKSAA